MIAIQTHRKISAQEYDSLTLSLLMTLNNSTAPTWAINIMASNIQRALASIRRHQLSLS